MPELDKIISEKNFVTDRISTQVRIIAIGLLATTWSLLIGQVNIFINILPCFRIHFILISIIAIIILMFDFLQYEFSYLNINKKIKIMNDKSLKKADYDEDNYFKCSQFFFIAKKCILYIGVAYFIGCMVKIIIA
jgi:hypothetical protein